MRATKHFFFCFLLVLTIIGVKVEAQQTAIEARIDQTDLLIGEQTTIELVVTTDPGKMVYFPVPTDFLMPGVEVLSLSVLDSSIVDNRLVIKQTILVTSFDSSLYLLPPFQVIDQGDTLYSDQLALKVSTIPVDVDNPEGFYDIKDVWAPPFVLADYYAFIFGVLLALFLICVIGYVVQRFKNRKTNKVVVAQTPSLPPYDEAMKELNEVKLQKLWQQGREKEYHTRITDVLRHYITRRYSINAMEMTSSEVLDVLQAYSDSEAVLVSLKQILHLADYVKFAKLHPLPDENDLSMMNAYLFINQTKPSEPLDRPIEPTSTEHPELVSTNESKSKGQVI